MSEVWEAARKERKATLVWLKDQKVELEKNPAALIGALNEKIALVRQMSNRVRDEVFSAQAIMIALKREKYTADDAYEAALSSALHDTSLLSDIEQKKLPRSQEERERHFRRSFLPAYNDKLEAERHVEEWELYQKMINSIYYSLKDTNDNILTQLSVIKQQYFSGELELDKKAVGLASWLSEDAKELVAGASSRFTEELDLTNEDMEARWDSSPIKQPISQSGRK